MYVAILATQHMLPITNIRKPAEPTKVTVSIVTSVTKTNCVTTTANIISRRLLSQKMM